MKKVLKSINITKLLVLFSLLSAVLVCLTNVHAYSSLANYKPTYGALTSNVNFRSIPTTSSSIIKVISKGTAVKMLATIDSFYIVQLGTNEVGVVSKNYVKTTSTAPAKASIYTSILKSNGTINGNSVNLRRGPGTSFASISKLSKNTSVKVIGYIGNWYVIVTNSGTVGMVTKQYVTLASGGSSSSAGSTSGETTTVLGDTNEQLILTLINNARTAAGLPKLVMDSKILKIARLKAQDMVKNSYFSHSSPTYGSPFKMMDDYDISYKVAGENIAGNPDLNAAVTAWMNSPTHKENILSSAYNYIGIGVTKSDTYGYVIVAMFVGR